MVDAFVNGAILSRSYNEAYKIIERIASNNYQWPTNREISKRRVVGVHEVDALTSLSTQNKLPPKLKDLGSFTVPCNLEESYYGKVLYDLGVNINLIPKSIFKLLRIDEVRPTTVTLQIADRSLAYPEGKMDDVLVRVDKFISPIDFIVLEFEADKEVLIILRRPFLTTRRMLIDVQKRELTMRVQDDQVTFNVLKAMKFPDSAEECLVMEELETLVSIECKSNFEEDPLENTLGSKPLEDGKGNENMALMETNQWSYVQPL
ncbi:uncharacterized protein LOC108455302 [Gossypium arboreum]|uniref:uncharacterized protein LOC108455302 n=1 Tax=Gossypium arboreum TaxID=29729 RepID=UPI000818FED9|nr:uncharacterized protein LOC108455302 [Gossypium arboreum]